MENTSKGIEAFVLNYNGGSKILTVLSSLVGELVEGRITVIDNASQDNSVAGIIEKFPKIRIIRMAKNSTAFAFNDAVANAKSEWVLLWLGDIIATRGFLKPLLEHAKPEVFAVSPRILPTPNSNNRKGWGRTELRFHLGHPIINFEAEPLPTQEQSFSPNAGLFNRDKFAKLGGFDWVFFPAFYEEVDLGCRAGRQGWKCIHEPRSVALHDHDGTNRTAFRDIDVVIYRNKHLFIWRNAGGWDLLKYGITLPAYLLVGTVLHGKSCLVGFVKAIMRLY